MNNPQYLATHIQSDVYLRERLIPKPGDLTFVHSSDLRLALERLRTDSSINLLDYGCGGSPYRSLFPNADYRRADFLQQEGDVLDYILDENSCVKEKDQTFDFILSTQVLEHVDDPRSYIRECHRLLKSGGQLYISTHGGYPDHGCPYDYYRWTADGLARNLQSLGFEICRLEKQTTGPRSLFFQCDCHYQSLSAPRRSIFGMALHAFKLIYARIQPWLHRMCDRYFSDNRVVTKQLDNHTTYIVTACLARKI